MRGGALGSERGYPQLLAFTPRLSIVDGAIAITPIMVVSIWLAKVTCIYVTDPVSRASYVCSGAGLRERERLH